MIEQARDVYVWAVVYQDDTLLCEEDAEQGFASVKQDDVKLLALIPLQGVMAPCHVSIPQGAQPVFFRRRSIAINSPDGQVRSTVHCIGWKKDGQEVYLFVFDDGSTLLTDNLQAV